MQLFRAFPFHAGASDMDPGHPRYVPRELQGGGRHDNPDLYGAMYVSETPLAAVAEHLAHLRGQRLEGADLVRNGLPVCLVELSAKVDETLVDLDEPRVLAAERLLPSQVATRERTVTQRWAARLFRTRRSATGIRWWSTLEASWLHVTLFDRALPRVAVVEPPERLDIDHPDVRAAAEALGIRIAR